MKYVMQLGIITGICFFAELLYIVLPLPVPASIYGLLILFFLLMTKTLKLEQVEEVSGFFLAIMPILFLSPSVSLITSFDTIQGQVLPLLLVIVLSTICTMVLTGLVAQTMIRRKKKSTPIEKEEEVHE